MKKIVLSLLTAAFTMTALAWCDKNEHAPGVKSQTYVLVHGAWQASYVWDAVRDDLIKKGNKVIVVALPGHGSDMTPTHTLTLNVYRDKVIAAISNAGEKVILVGHSMGGMVVTAVAEQIPAKISRLVYIGAFVPASGQSLGELANTDPDSKLGLQLSLSADKLTLDVNRDSLTDLFISDGTPAAKQQVIDNYRPEPAIPFGDKVTLTKEGFGSVEKVYIKTLQDIVISPGFQDRMITGAGIKAIYSVKTSHSPFLAKPQEVSALLLKMGK
jgi:pimeloyl-ACP methyl ester carboxylesterase